MHHATTVLRIERADGQGPFSREVFASAMNAAMGDPDGDWHEEFPSSIEAFGHVDGIVYCGTTTARDLVRWFPAPMRDVLAEHGFGLSIYRVPTEDVTRADGAMQVLFDGIWAKREHRPFAPRHERGMLRRRMRDAQPWAMCPAPDAGRRAITA